MLGIRQQLHTSITSADLQEALDLGARVVYLAKTETPGTWDAILETEAADGDPRSIVLNWLGSVDPMTLESKMLENPSMDEGVGKAAIVVLAEMVVGNGGA